MPKPLYIPNTDQKLARQGREIRRLERRGAGPWHYVGGTNFDGTAEPAFENSWQNLGGTTMNLRYRWALGGGVELQGSITGGVLGTRVFTLPLNYRPEGGDLRLNGSDDLGALVVWQVLTDGSVICGL